MSSTNPLTGPSASTVAMSARQEFTPEQLERIKSVVNCLVTSSGLERTPGSAVADFLHTQDLMSSRTGPITPVEQSSSLSFLDLPAEVRNKIYQSWKARFEKMALFNLDLLEMSFVDCCSLRSGQRLIKRALHHLLHEVDSVPKLMVLEGFISEDEVDENADEDGQEQTNEVGEDAEKPEEEEQAEEDQDMLQD
ncbi:hypothetical protein D6C83_05602, partial [Aureobasidium pullulans]